MKIEHLYRTAAVSFTAGRYIFNDKGPEQKSSAPESKEAAPPTAEKVADEKAKVDQKKVALQTRIDQYKKSPNDAIKKAAEQAQKDLDAVKDKPNLSVEQIQANLDRITSILEHADQTRLLDERVKKMRDDADKISKGWQAEVQKYNDGLLQTHPKISADAKKSLATLLEGTIEDLDGNVLLAIFTATQKPKVSVEEYTKDAQAFQKINKVLDAEQDKLYGKTGDLKQKLQDIHSDYTADAHAIVILDYAKDSASAIADAEHATAFAEQSLDKWSKANGNEDVQVAKDYAHGLGVNAVAMLKLLTKPSDAGKRALVLATLKDDLLSIVSDPRKNEVSTDRGITASVMKRGGIKHDAFSQNFNAFTEGVELTGTGVTQEQMNESVFQVSANPNFRLEGSGMQMMVLPKGTAVKLLGLTTHHVETEKGRKADYIRVQLNPPDGPIGYVAAEYVDFKKPILHMDLYKPKENKEAAPAAIAVVTELSPDDKKAVGAAETGQTVMVTVGTQKIGIKRLAAGQFEVDGKPYDMAGAFQAALDSGNKKQKQKVA